jgi:hypothetical protein
MTRGDYLREIAKLARCQLITECYRWWYEEQALHSASLMTCSLNDLGWTLIQPRGLANMLYKSNI